MKSHTHYLWFHTKQQQEILDITDQVAEQVATSGVRDGMVLVSAMHITASVFVNHHESGLWQDVLNWLEDTIAPWDPGWPCGRATLRLSAAWCPGESCRRVFPLPVPP